MANQAFITVYGRLIKEPEHSVKNDNTVVNFTIAVNTTLKRADGEGYESNFYNVSYWGKPAEYLLEKIEKGTQVIVVGELVLQKYKNQTTGAEGQSLNIRAYNVSPVSGYKSAPRRENKSAEDNKAPF